MRPIDHSGRTALVTGAGSGIGAAVARELAGLGARVHAVDLSADVVQALADEVPGVEPVVCDLADLDGLAALPTDVDILVNNAGIQHVSPIEEFPLEKFELIMRLMLHSPFHLVRQVLPHMYERGFGRIVHVSSAHGLRASANKSAYVAAKHGIEGLSKTIALEGAPHGVTSVTVNPGYVRTPLVEKQIADQARVNGIPEGEVVERIMLTQMPVKRLVEPQDVAEVVAFLTGPASASMTGSSYTIDGGWTAH